LDDGQRLPDTGNDRARALIPDAPERSNQVGRFSFELYQCFRAVPQNTPELRRLLSCFAAAFPVFLQLCFCIVAKFGILAKSGNIPLQAPVRLARLVATKAKTDAKEKEE